MIRKAEERDLQRIAEIIIFGKRVAYCSIFQNDMVSFNELRVVALYNELYNDSEKWKNMLVYDDGIVKAVINYIDTENKDTIEILDFYVEPFFKGEGIGRKLINQLCNKVKRQYNTIILWVIKDNISARKFYERNGFQRTDNERLIEGTNKLEMQYVRYL